MCPAVKADNGAGGKDVSAFVHDFSANRTCAVPIEKLKAERSRNTEKISDLQNRNRKLSEQITKLENNDIIGMVREIGMTPEQLAALLSGKAADSPATDEYEETEGYEHEN